MKMKLKNIFIHRRFLFFLALFTFFSLIVNNNLYSQAYIARVGEVTGNIQIIKAAQGKSGKGGSRGSKLAHNDILAVGVNSKATILYQDGTRIRVFANSRVKVQQGKKSFAAELEKGSFWLHKKKGGRKVFIIKTAQAAIGVKGTDLAVGVNSSKTSISVFSGSVIVKNKAQKIVLAEGQMLDNITFESSLKDIIASIPHKISILPDQLKIEPKTIKIDE